MDLKSKAGTYRALDRHGVAMEERVPLDWVGAALRASFWESTGFRIRRIVYRNSGRLVVYKLLIKVGFNCSWVTLTRLVWVNPSFGLNFRK